MFGLQSLGALLGDSELRTLLTQVATRKIQTDLKMLQAHGELVRSLTDNRRAGAPGDALKRVVREHLEYYSALIDLSDGFHQHLLELLAAHGREGGGEATVNGLTLPLAAAPGATLRSPFKVSNNRAEPIEVTFRASPFVSDDGSRLTPSNISFDPPGCAIASGGDCVIEAVIPVGRDFAVGSTWFATLSADGLEAMRIAVRLTVEEPAVAVEEIVKPVRRRAAKTGPKRVERKSA